jgi:hypothetical protein
MPDSSRCSLRENPGSLAIFAAIRLASSYRRLGYSPAIIAAREANLDEPISNIRITDVAVQIGLEGDEFDSALDYAADQGWFEDAEVADSASWVSLTPASVAAAKS